MDLGVVLRIHMEQAGRSASTIRLYQKRVRAFARWYGNHVENASIETMTRYLVEELTPAGVSPVAQDQYVSALRVVYVEVLRAYTSKTFTLARPKVPPRKVVRPAGWAPATEKRCPRCERTRGAVEFCRSARNPDGLDGWCKDCRRDYMRERPPPG